MDNCKSIMVILVSQRSKAAVEVQKILTEWGCSIKTRLGVHDGVGDRCSDTGLIILELVDEKAKREELRSKLVSLDGVSAQLVDLCV
jgi:hypothetical protein